jgi:flagellar hook-associated protein 1 FlgK
MLGLFGSLNMAARSLSVEQEASAVAGQNLANVNNTAYARETLNVTSATPLQTPVGQEGTGVQAVSITEARDTLLDGQIQSEGSVTGSLNSQQNALEDAQAYLNEQLTNSTSTGAASSPDGLAADLSGFFGSLQTLSTDPSNIADRQTVIQSAQELAGQFNSVSSGLATVQANLNSSITSDVAASNQDLSDIASLNQQIVVATASGGTANDLVDLREQKIEDLAGKVNLTTTAQPDGSVDVSIGGVTMVSGGNTPDSLQAYDSGGGNMLVRAQNAGTTLTLSGGSIEGSITARDGALATLQTSVNTLASQVVTQVNNVYSKGYDLNGNTGQNFFTGASAANIGVNSSVVSDPSTFQASGAAGDVGDNTVVLALAQLASQPVANNQTFSQSYSSTVSALGSALSSVNDQSNNSAAVTQMLTAQRSSESGVSTDDEMTNLIQFQKAYQASAELISTLNEMLETLVTMKTE